MSQVDKEHHEIVVMLGKLETKLEHINDQLKVIHERAGERKKEIQNVEAVARGNSNRLVPVESKVTSIDERLKALEASEVSSLNRLTILETLSSSNRTWIMIGLTGVMTIAVLLDIFWKS